MFFFPFFIVNTKGEIIWGFFVFLFGVWWWVFLSFRESVLFFQTTRKGLLFIVLEMVPNASLENLNYVLCQGFITHGGLHL